jgi:hypothetical protein
LLLLAGEPAAVEYTEREEDCHEWIESCVVRAGETVLSLDAEMLAGGGGGGGGGSASAGSSGADSDPDAARAQPVEVLLLATRKAVLVLHHSFFQRAPLGSPASGCIGRLLRRADIVLVGVDLKKDVHLVLLAFPVGPAAAAAAAAAAGAGASASAQTLTPARIFDLKAMAERIKRDWPAELPLDKLGLEGQALHFYPRARPWKPRNFYGHRQKQQLFMWRQRPLRQWQLDYCAMDGWSGRAIFDAQRALFARLSGGRDLLEEHSHGAVRSRSERLAAAAAAGASAGAGAVASRNAASSQPQSPARPASMGGPGPASASAPVSPRSAFREPGGFSSGAGTSAGAGAGASEAASLPESGDSATLAAGGVAGLERVRVGLERLAVDSADDGAAGGGSLGLGPHLLVPPRTLLGGPALVAAGLNGGMPPMISGGMPPLAPSPAVLQQQRLEREQRERELRDREREQRDREQRDREREREVEAQKLDRARVEAERRALEAESQRQREREARLLEAEAEARRRSEALALEAEAQRQREVRLREAEAEARRQREAAELAQRELQRERERLLTLQQAAAAAAELAQSEQRRVLAEAEAAAAVHAESKRERGQARAPRSTERAAAAIEAAEDAGLDDAGFLAALVERSGFGKRRNELIAYARARTALSRHLGAEVLTNREFRERVAACGAGFRLISLASTGRTALSVRRRPAGQLGEM